MHVSALISGIAAAMRSPVRVSRLRRGVLGTFAALLVPIAMASGGCVVGDDDNNDSFNPYNTDPVPDGPALDYYASVEVGNAESLRETLHAVIDDHEWHYYTHSSHPDLWDMLEMAQEDPEDPERVIDIYRNASYPRWNAGNDDYDREHTWPKSLGFPRNIKYNYPYTDGHHLMLANGDYNSERGNKPYGYCTSASCEEWQTDANGDHEGSTPEERESSNWTRGFNLNGVWEVWSGRRGDVARAMFYMDVRYEGGTHGVTDRMEPDLILTDDLELIVSDTSTNKTEGYMGHLSTLLEWHQQDPVSEEERFRNNVIQAFQKNRNPFIDHPEWVDCIYLGQCGERPEIDPWINELHYDNASADSGEGIEIAGAAGTDLSRYSLIAYNGSNGEMYKTVTLTGVIPDFGDGAGAVWFDVPSLQNGSPDGLALVDSCEEVVQMFAYEGSFTAADGPAMGLLLSDIGAAESATTMAGTSLQLIGTGCAYSDFSWGDGKAASPDAANDGQSLNCL